MSAPSLKTSARSMIILIAAAAALFAVDIGVYVVSSGSLTKCRADLLSRQDQVENSRKIAERLGDSRTRFLSASDQLRTLESSVSAGWYVPTLLKQLENTGRQVHLKVLSVRPRTEPAAAVNSAADRPAASTDGAASTKVAKKSVPKPYDTLLIDIEVEGSYYNTMDFLQRLTQFPKIIAVDTIQMMPASNSLAPGKSPLLTVQLSLRAFVFPAETEKKSGTHEAITLPDPQSSELRAQSSPDRRSEYEAG